MSLSPSSRVARQPHESACPIMALRSSGHLASLSSNAKPRGNQSGDRAGIRVRARTIGRVRHGKEERGPGWNRMSDGLSFDAAAHPHCPALHSLKSSARDAGRGQFALPVFLLRWCSSKHVLRGCGYELQLPSTFPRSISLVVPDLSGND